MTAAHVIDPAPASDETLNVFAAAAIDNAAVAMTMVDRDGVVVHLNAAARALIVDHAEGFAETFGLRALDPQGARIDLSAVLFPHRRPSDRNEVRVGEVALGAVQLSVRTSPVRSGPGAPVGDLIEWIDVTRDRQAAGMIQAIDKVQAVIEFSLDGQILNANANFLDAMDYRLEDIVGRHHSMFVPAADAAGLAISPPSTAATPARRQTVSCRIRPRPPRWFPPTGPRAARPPRGRGRGA